MTVSTFFPAAQPKSFLYIRATLPAVPPSSRPDAGFSAVVIPSPLIRERGEVALLIFVPAG
jgi:hypothetical protein